MHALGGIPLMSFVAFIDTYFVICILWKGIVHILFCVILFSLSNKIFYLKKKKKKKQKALPSIQRW